MSDIPLACNHTSPEFQDFLSKFETLYSNIKTENPFAIFFTGDFNAHSQLWWPDVMNCREKAQYFNDYFSQQCNPVINNSVLPMLGFLTNKRLDNITIKDNEIISLIRKINPNKATGSDGISGQMLLLCDGSVILPLQIIFTNIVTTSIYPAIWKLSKVTPVFKKGDKQLIKNYRLISLLPICGKILEKIIFNNLYSYLHTNNLLTKNQSGFRPVYCEATTTASSSKILDIGSESHPGILSGCRLMDVNILR